MITISDMPLFTINTKVPPFVVTKESKKQLTCAENYIEDLHNTFSPLPNVALETKILEVAYRVFLALSSPILLPIVLVFDAVNRGCIDPAKESIKKFTKDEINESDQILSKQIAWLKSHKPEGWQPYAWKLIRKGRHENPQKELKRLATMGVLNNNRNGKLEKALNSVQVKSPNPLKRLQTKMLMAQALEVKDLYGSTHHVLMHAQAAKWAIFSHLIKEFTRKFHPEKDISHYKFLRAPCETIDLSFLDSMWKLFFTQPDTVQDYLDSHWFGGINDDDPKVREKLISADAYFYNFQRFESSLFFLINNDNIFNNHTAIENFSKKVIQHFCPSLKEGDVLTAYVKKITQAAFKKAECGNLFVISLPKKDSYQIQYRAHPYGKVCQCHDKEESPKILNKLQNEILDANNMCKWMFPIPQYRLYTPRLTPGDGKSIFLLTPFTKEERQSIKAPIREIVEEVYKKAQEVPKSRSFWL